MNNNSTQNQIDVTQSFAAFNDIAEQNHASSDVIFEVKEHAAFGQFVSESAAFPTFTAI